MPAQEGISQAGANFSADYAAALITPRVAAVDFKKRKAGAPHRRPGLARPGTGGIQVEGYCVKCRAKKEIKNAQQITMKNGRPATSGECPDCGTKIFKIGAGK